MMTHLHLSQNFSSVNWRFTDIILKCASLPRSVKFHQDSQSRGKSKYNPLRHKHQLDQVKSMLFCLSRCGFHEFPVLGNLVPEACVPSAMPKPHNTSTQPLTIPRRLTDASHILHNSISPTLATVIRHCLHSGVFFLFCFFNTGFKRTRPHWADLHLVASCLFIHEDLCTWGWHHFLCSKTSLHHIPFLLVQLISLQNKIVQVHVNWMFNLYHTWLVLRNWH